MTARSFRLRHLAWHFADGRTTFSIGLEQVSPRRRWFAFHADAALTQKGDPSVGWSAIAGGRKGRFDPTIVGDQDAGEWEAWATAADLVHELLSCGDTLIRAPRGVTRSAAQRWVDAKRDPMNAGLADHLVWWLRDEAARKGTTL